MRVSLCRASQFKTVQTLWPHTARAALWCSEGAMMLACGMPVM